MQFVFLWQSFDLRLNGAANIMYNNFGTVNQALRLLVNGDLLTIMSSKAIIVIL
jgi:hypothetical protein